ncbi:hypothetical protein [Streptomyces sp. CAU 1734]|uniref:hypothetical protein n=1 Tax=Streptomyces sp. CAU 1734 TaxID=3140360 RepID=UPI00326123A5
MTDDRTPADGTDHTGRNTSAHGPGAGPDGTPDRTSGRAPDRKRGKRAGRPERRGRTGPRPSAARPGRRTTPRRALCREVASTIAVLADEFDFTAMRTYRSFTFDDHPRYLREVEALLASLARRQLHTAVALFDPGEFALFCAEENIDADSALARSRYTAEFASRGGTLPYTGEPLAVLLPRLVDRAVRHATWEYASLLLTDVGECADCGQNIGRAALDRAGHLLTRLLDAAGPGSHHLVCSVPAPEDNLLATLRADGDKPAGAPATGGRAGNPSQDARIDAAEAVEFVTVLATAIALGNPGGVVLRTRTSGSPDRLHGWRLERSSLLPLTEGEVFSAYCTDARTGEPLPPEPGVEYRAGFDIGADDPEPHR